MRRFHFQRRHATPDVKTGGMNFTKNLGMLVLAIFLIVYGIATTFTIAIPVVLLGVLALIAGVLILIGK